MGWKINLYEPPNLKSADDESHNYLKTGDFFWVLLSERFNYLSGVRKEDPFHKTLSGLDNYSTLLSYGISE